MILFFASENEYGNIGKCEERGRLDSRRKGRPSQTEKTTRPPRRRCHYFGHHIWIRLVRYLQ